jgi:hypothetical protein
LLREIFGPRDREAAGEPFTHVRGRESVDLLTIVEERHLLGRFTIEWVGHRYDGVREEAGAMHLVDE